MAESSSYKWLVLGNVMLTTFMAVLDATVVNTGLPVIMGTLGTSMNSAEWILTGYMLSMATILSAAGWLANRFGYKVIFLLSLSLFTFGSFMCGNSSSIGELILWRIIEGIGSGLLIPVGMAIITSVFPPKQRGLALGFWAISSAASVSFGPMIGGYLVDNFNWNYIFFVNVPIGIICFIFTMIVQKEIRLQSHLKFDFGGFMTSAIFLPAVLFGLSQVNSSTNAQGWNSPVVMGCMWLAAISFVLFIVIELSVKTPLIDLRIFKNRNFTFANIIVFIFGIGMFGSTFLMPLYMQDALGYTAFQAGLIFMPVGLLQAIASPIAGKLTRYIDARIIIGLGILMLSYSFYLNIFLTYQTDHAYILRSLIFRGVAFGMLYPPLLALSLRDIGPLQMAQASSITNIIRQVGGSFGVSLFTFMLVIRQNYHAQRFSESINYTGEMYRETINKLREFFLSTGAPSIENASEKASKLITKRIGIEAYINAINDDFFIGIIFVLISLLPIFFLNGKKQYTRLGEPHPSKFSISPKELSEQENKNL